MHYQQRRAEILLFQLVSGVTCGRAAIAAVAVDRAFMGHGAMGALITLHNVTVSYQRHPALHHISLRFEPGSLHAILGPNGSGKSTLLKTIKGLLKPDEGQVLLGGLKPRAIAYMPQYHQLEAGFPISVEELVLLGNWRQSGLLQGIGKPAREKVAQALAEVGLSGFEARRINTLSVGQLQRALFARVMVEDAPVILLDEPFSAVDAGTTERLWQVVKHWQAEGRTVLISLHNQQEALRQCPEAVLLAREVIASGATQNVLLPLNLAQAETMPEAWDDTAPTCAVHAHD